MESAAKVGAFVVLFFVLLAAAYSILQRSVFAPETDSYFIEFSDAGGLSAGSGVTLAGVRIGRVESITLIDPRTARAEIRVRKGTEIPDGTRAILPGSLISLGDRIIELIAPADYARMLAPGDTIAGRQMGAFEGILPDMDSTIAQLNDTMAAMQSLLEDEELIGGVKDITSQASDTLEKFGTLATRLDGVVARSGGQFETLLASTQGSLQNLEAVSYEVRSLVESGELQDRTIALLENMDSAVQKSSMLVSDIQGLVNDPEMRGSLERTMSNVEQATESGIRIAQNAEIITENGAVASEEAITLMQKANGLADEIQALVRDVRAALDDITGTASSLIPKALDVEFEGSLTRETDPAHTRVDINARIPTSESTGLYLGLYDAFESNKLNLQLTRAFGDRLDLRYGVYASKLGLGVDYLVAPGLALRSDLFGLNDSQLDFRLSYLFRDGFYGWLGVESIFDRNAIAAGVTIRK